MRSLTLLLYFLHYLVYKVYYKEDTSNGRDKTIRNLQTLSFSVSDELYLLWNSVKCIGIN